MKNLFVPDFSLMDFEFYDYRDVNMHYHQNVEMLVLLEGNMTLFLDEEDVLLSEGDFYVINVNRRHAMKANGQVLYVCLHMNFNLLSRYIDMNRIMFMCDSKKITSANLKKFHDIIQQIISSYFAKSGTAQVKINIMYYMLLNLLLENCVIYSDDERFQSRRNVEQGRLNEIVNYVYANYKDEIRLSDLAEQLYLSPAYLSKYIKNHLGMNFIDYVNNIRLYHAVEEIRGSDKKMTHIAVDNGFSSITAFNNTFKKIYDMTPTEFRTQAQIDAKKRHITERMDVQIAEKAKQYLSGQELERHPMEQEDLYVFADAYVQKAYNQYWKQMINIGKMSDLLMSDVQKHILVLKKNLQFSYVRIWDIYSDELDLNIEVGDGVYNFGKMDRIFDFLLENNIYPYIELGFKPVILVEKLDGYIISKEREILFKTQGEYRSFLYAMLTHYVNRYGNQEVEKWCFEQWKDPRMTKDGVYDSYFETFEAAYHTIKSISSKTKIGGGSIHHTFDEANYKKLLKQWQKRIVHPDFISLYSYPYYTGKAGQAIDRRRSQNPNYLKEKVKNVKDHMNQIGFNVNEIHVTEWNSTVSNRNPMNDSVYKGAYIMKNIIDNIGMVDVLGYWLGSDIFSQHRDLNLVFNGGVGLLSRDGIKKPTYYAYDFMNRMGEFLLGKYENTLVTSNGHDDYFVASHNMKSPSYKYYKTPENEVDINRQEQYFEDLKPVKINYRINHVRNGKYQIKIRRISNKEGSAADEWIRMGQFSNLTMSDVEYLRQISTSRVTMRESEVVDGVLNFEEALESNEIIHIHITYRL